MYEYEHDHSSMEKNYEYLRINNFNYHRARVGAYKRNIIISPCGGFTEDERDMDLSSSSLITIHF